ncbi:hypothetical protein ABW20_dc0110624 [Dactylellina cionopaga]|nr:hypothetical protein ABW20_dc0110624 [Dactylellina cionopaga]
MSRRPRRHEKRNTEVPMETRLKLAIQAYKHQNHPSIRAAATAHSVSHVTLSRRLNGNTGNRAVAHQSQLAVPPGAEKALVTWVIRLYSWGFPPRMDMVRYMAEKLAGRQLNDKCIYRFLNRHSELRTAYSRALDNARARADDPEAITQFYSLFTKTKL